MINRLVVMSGSPFSRAVSMLKSGQSRLLSCPHIVACLVLCASQLATGCAAPMQVYKLYPGPSLDSSEVARIQLADGTAIVIDGLNISATEYDVVMVFPGRHRLASGFRYSIVRSEKWEADLRYPFNCQTGNSEALLQAGKTYSLRHAKSGLEVLDAGSGRAIWHCREN